MMIYYKLDSIIAILRDVKQQTSDISAAEGGDACNKQIRSKKNSELSWTTEDEDRRARDGPISVLERRMPSGNHRCQLETSPIHGVSDRKITDTCSIFQHAMFDCHV